MKIKNEYKELTENILNDEAFLLLKNERHHGTNRYDHCKRVAHVSFWLSKIFKGDKKSATIAGLLHDFFYGDSSYLEHPKVSSANAKKYYAITDKEAEIIESHMYHYALVKNSYSFLNKKNQVKAKKYKPNCKEGYLVCFADMLVSIFEGSIFEVRYGVCLYLLFIINLIRY